MSASLSLCTALCAACAPEQAPTPSEALERALAEAWRTGASAWPGVAVPADDFVRHLASHLPTGESIDAFLRAVKLDDFYLACGCLLGLPAALASFERHVLVHVRGFVRPMDESGDLADEVAALLRARLFVASPGSLQPPKIASYSGRGALLAWLRVCATRTALNLRAERHQPVAELDERAMADALSPGPDTDPELDRIRDRYRPAFEEAVRDAFTALAPEQRQILRLHLVARLGSERIGALYHVHQTTAARWVAAAREAVSRETRRLLQERLHVSTEELESLARLMRSALDVSLISLLRTSSE
jgi:RNA polymerase sigma-70 factor (ECF subfamily)